MAQYRYEITSQRSIKRGQLNADTLEEAATQIKQPGWYISYLKAERADEDTGVFFGWRSKFSAYDRINFTDHLAASIRAGTPIQEALDAYVEDGDRKSEVIDTISKDVQRGKKLSEAMAKHSGSFSPLYTALVEAGEISGSLDETLEYLANELRRDYEFVSKVKSAMFYPLVVLAVSLLVLVLIIGLVVPKIIDITRNFGGDLPLITTVMVSIASFLNSHFLIIGAIVFSSFTAVIYAVKTPSLNRRLKAKLITLPLIGKIARQYILARFLRVIGGCIKYGIQLPTALDLSVRIVGNPVYQTACENINNKITHGQNLSSSLAEEEKLLFPPIISRTIKGAEKTGNMDIRMLQLSLYFEAEVNRNLKRLTELIEPVMIILLGLLVALIAISVIAPIYQITSRIK